MKTVVAAIYKGDILDFLVKVALSLVNNVNVNCQTSNIIIFYKDFLTVNLNFLQSATVTATRPDACSTRDCTNKRATAVIV